MAGAMLHEVDFNIFVDVLSGPFDLDIPNQVILPLHKAGMMKGSVSGRSDDKLYIQFSFNMVSGLACI